MVKNPPAKAGDKRHGFSLWVGRIPWRRKWKPTPVFSPGQFHGQRRLVGYHPWDHEESDTTDHAGTNGIIHYILLRLAFVLVVG